MKKTAFLLSLLWLAMTFSAFAQPTVTMVTGKTPVGFEEEINEFMKQDSAVFPPPNAYLFVGSSTIRMWSTLEEDFIGTPIIHRGFGGSTMKALNYYTDRIVLPYRPRHIIVYEGDNDLAQGSSVNDLIARCDTFVMNVQKALPKTTIWFMSIKPSASRKQNLEAQKEANARLKGLTKKYRRVNFIDITPLMYDASGKLKAGYFEQDSLHVTRECYRQWASLIRKELKLVK